MKATPRAQANVLKFFGRTHHTLSFKQEAAKLVVLHNRSISSVSADLSVPIQTLSKWVAKARAGTLQAEPSKAVSEQQMKLSRLKSQVRLLQDGERDH